MGIFNNYLNAMITQQSKNFFAKPQTLSLLQQAVAKKANGPYTPKPAGIAADSLVRYTAPLNTNAAAPAPTAGPLAVFAPTSRGIGLKAGLAALSLAAAKVGSFTTQLVTGASAKLSAAVGGGYAALTNGVSALFVSKANKATPSRDFGLPTLPKLASLEDMVDFNKFGR